MSSSLPGPFEGEDEDDTMENPIQPSQENIEARQQKGV
jgi:hypothetical protein